MNVKCDGYDAPQRNTHMRNIPAVAHAILATLAITSVILITATPVRATENLSIVSEARAWTNGHLPSAVAQDPDIAGCISGDDGYAACERAIGNLGSHMAGTSGPGRLALETALYMAHTSVDAVVFGASSDVSNATPAQKRAATSHTNQRNAALRMILRHARKYHAGSIMAFAQMEMQDAH